MELSAGTMVTANVRLTRPLGEGAMGCVWVADHLTLRTEVAVKFISAQVAGTDPQIMARFLQEASVAAQIKSPHVVQTFDQGVMGDGTPYIVMELLDGESLQERLTREGRLPLGLVARILMQLSRALSRAHDVGVVHRDIKPDNIFLVPGDDGPFCKILDFGIAKQTALPSMGGLTSPGTMVGTPEYMSPEQVLSAKDVDFRADLWGLAVTAYHCITGELPFVAEALGQLCVLLLDGRFAPPSQLVQGLPPGTDEWMTRALARQPVDRFSSAKEMASTFTRIVAASQPVDADLLLSATGTGGNLPALTGSGAVQQPAGQPAGQPAPAQPALAEPALGGSGVAQQAMAEPTAGSGAAPAVSASMQGSAAGNVAVVAGHGTLTGSSTTHRAEPRRMPWAMLVLGGLAAVGAAVGAVVIVASPSGESAPASPPEPSASAEAPQTTSAAPTATASAAEPTPSASASVAASAAASASASVAPVATAPPRPPPRPARPPATGKKGNVQPIFR